ncbi:hypothetical protein D3C72_1722600 [compost metagenome]
MEIIFLVEYLTVRYFLTRVLILNLSGNVLGISLLITQIYAENYYEKMKLSKEA